jgi:hypothetical protein
MKLIGNKVPTYYNPLQVSGNLNVTGGSIVQFFDGTDYYPNREGTPSSPIIIEHVLSVANPDEAITGAITVELATLWYENGVIITSLTEGYELIDRKVKVSKNIPAGISVEIKAITQFIDPRSNKIYEREDITYLRTVVKSESPYQLTLSQRGSIFFDGHRNPNTSTTVTASLKKGAEAITDFTDITLKWLNSEGLDAVENELYADSVSDDGDALTVDKTYIDHEIILCEAWKGDEMIASDTVTFVRKFNSIRTEVRIPQLPLLPEVKQLSCSVIITDMLGNVDVDAAFLVTWLVSENGIERQVGEGANTQIPISSINLKAANLSIYPDIKRREAFAALTTIDDGEEALLTDDDDNVLTVETFGL